jgi:anti-sigma factor RsiW
MSETTLSGAARPAAHVARLTLTRLHAGELGPAEADAVHAHLRACAACTAKREEAAAEAARFEARIPFARFEAGVRGKLAAPPPARLQAWTRAWLPRLLPALAVAGVVALVARTSLPGAEGPRTPGVKGAGAMVLAIAAPDGTQRQAFPGTPAPLAPGDRVRVGYVPQEGQRWVLALSVDAAGVVTPLYPEAGGESLPAEEGPGPHFLPGALEFTGSGPEAVVVVLGQEPLAMEQAVAAAREAYRQAGGDVGRLPPLALPGEQTRQVVQKP